MRLFILIFSLCVSSIYAQERALDQVLFDAYEDYKETQISDRRFKHEDIQPLIAELQNHPDFIVKKQGESIEGRDIHLISYGTGSQSVLLWSQMHGDEPTATMALFDIFNFLMGSDDYNSLKQLLKEELTLYFIPMLNPDGAERFKRRNALNIDLNRDALRLQSPEARILKSVRDSLSAQWGFNLHDQNRYYAAGILNPHTASISFLAPAYNYDKEINEVRGNAMKLIAEMNAILQKYIPGKVAKYNDDFEPRAFGDNIQKWGTSTILIESGGLKDDREKQYLRKLHFVTILSALHSIADRSYESRLLSEYEYIPFNESNTFADLLIRETKVEVENQEFIVDIAFRNHEVDYNEAQDYYFKSGIQDIGDLSIFYGYEEIDATGYEIEVGKVFPRKVRNVREIRRLSWRSLIDRGYTHVYVEDMPEEWVLQNLPLSFSKPGKKIDSQIDISKNPGLILKRDGKIKWVVINGQAFDVEADLKKIQADFEALDE